MTSSFAQILAEADFKTVLVDRPTAEQSELSTQEMRLNALPFTDKLLRIKPKIVCFVGKKIWDVYESVIRKSARPIDHARNSPVVKSEVQAFETAAIPVPGVTTTSTCDVKQEAPDQVESKPIIRNTVPSTPQSQSRGNRTPTRPKVRFDWTKPRPFRLPHGDDDSQVLSYTYFWVVPNTSGLERTPVSLDSHTESY
jgi:TDG/mug DNA glycosylase family protein